MHNIVKVHHPLARTSSQPLLLVNQYRQSAANMKFLAILALPLVLVSAVPAPAPAPHHSASEISAFFGSLSSHHKEGVAIARRTDECYAPEACDALNALSTT